MSELPFGPIVDSAPDGYEPTMQLAWINGIAEHDQFGMIPPTLFQRFRKREGNEDFVWVPVEHYYPSRDQR